MATTIKEVMTRNPSIIPAGTTLMQAANIMGLMGCGVLPIGTWEKLEGVITDRDIVVRAVAKGVDVGSALVSDHMTTDLFYCNEDDMLEQAAENMREHNIGRLVVKDRSGKACSIITFGCMLRKEKDLQEVGKVIERAVGNKADEESDTESIIMASLPMMN